MLLVLLFKHITNVSVLLLGEFNLLHVRMFKIPSREKNAIPIGLICFIYTIFKSLLCFPTEMT